MLLGWLEGQRGSQGEVCSCVETEILRVPHRECISQLLPRNTFLDRGTPLLHMLVHRSEDKLRNPKLSVVCCFVFPCELSTERMQNLVVTLLNVYLEAAAVFVFYEISFAKEDRITILSDRLRWHGVFLVIKILV